MEITLPNGAKVVCTDDHKFLVDGKWIAARDLVKKI